MGNPEQCVGKVDNQVRRIITKELAVRIREKLCGNEAARNSGGHDVYAVRHNGVVRGSVSIRRGSEKDKGHDFIPRDLNITPHFAKEIGICNKDLDDYIKCLNDKEQVTQPALPAPAEPDRPWDKDWVAIQEAETAQRIERLAGISTRERIEDAVRAELAGCSVKFEEESPSLTRFAIMAPDGTILSQAFPHLKETDISVMDDEQLRRYVRQLCGR